MSVPDGEEGSPASSPPPRLRARLLAAPFRVLLHEPEIPPNTGNVARLCGATGCPLHLSGQLGFQIDDKAVRRAGLDYWHLVEVHRHESFDAALASLRALSPGGRLWLFSARARRSCFDVSFSFGDTLVFGRESAGLPDDILAAFPDQVVGIPMPGAVRSLNLANSVAIAVYEALRQNDALGVDASRD